jgi:hypothetical protein
VWSYLAIHAGATVIFVATIAGGIPPLTLRWQFNGVDIPGANLNSLVLTNVQPAQSDYYDLTISTAAGEVLSTTATLLVQGGTLGPLLGSPVYAGGNLQFTLSTAAGKTYKAQFKQQLTHAMWTDVQTVNGDGTVKVITVSAAGPTGFYQIVQLP